MLSHCPHTPGAGRVALAVSVLATALGAGPTVAAAPNHDGAPRAKRVVVIIGDDLGIDRVGCYGDPAARTPNIDRLAAEGTRFEVCWANPVCSPSRALIATGRYAHVTGVGRNIFENFELRPEFFELDDLAPASVDWLGKWHLSRRPEHPIECGVTHLGSLRSLVGMWDYWHWLKNYDGFETPIERYATKDTGVDVLRSTATIVIAATNAPHGPFHTPPPDLQSYGSISPDDKPRLFRAMVESLDSVVGRIARGLDEDTLLIFIGDNGSPMPVAEPGEDPLHMKGTLYEGGIRVPLILRGPGIPRGEVRTDLASLVDLLPTIADALGVAPPPDADGISLLGPERREWVYAEQFAPSGTGPWVEFEQAISDGRWKMIRRFHDPDELYDLATDPFEVSPLDLDNLSSDARDGYERLQEWLPFEPEGPGLGDD